MSRRLFAIDLITLTRSADPDVKRRLLTALVDLFIAAHDVCSPDDAESLGKLMAELIFDLDADSRAEFAVRLATCATAPREMIVKLANDRIAVARPVLAVSPVLTDDDLIEIAQTQGKEHLLALSGRPALPQSVTEQLILRGFRPAILRAISNPDAELSTACRAVLDRLASSDIELRKALEIRDGDMAAGNSGGAEEMLHLEEPASDEEAEPDVLVLSNEPAAAAERSDEDESEAIQVRESDLLAAARTRRLDDAMEMFSALAGEREAQVATLFRNADIGSIAAHCKRAGISGLTFEAVAELCLHLADAPPYRVLAAIKKNRSAF